MKVIPYQIRQWLSTLHSDHKRIARGAAWIALFVLIGKLAGAAKEMAVAYRYGVSGIVDAYQLAFTIVIWLPSTLISVISMVLIPTLVRLRQQDPADRDLFLKEMHGTTLLVGCLFILVSIFLGPQAVTYLASTLSSSTQQMAQHLILGMAPVALLSLIIGVCAARLQAREKQVNTLLESVPAAAILSFVLLWPAGSDVAPLLWGFLLGHALQAVWLAYLARQADGQSIKPRWSWHSPHWPEVYQAVGITAIGQYILSFITPIDQYFAAQLGDHAIATLSYAYRIITLLLGLGSMAIARATLPVLSGIAASGNLYRARSVALKWSGLMLFVGTVVTVISWLAAPWIVHLLFERGAFTAENTTTVATVLRWGLVQVPFSFASWGLVQLLASCGYYWIISLIATTNLLMKLLMNVLLTPILGVSGIALAFGITSIIGLLLFFIASYFMPKLGNPTGRPKDISNRS